MIQITFWWLNLGTKLLCQQKSSDGVRLDVAIVTGRFAEQ